MPAGDPPLTLRDLAEMPVSRLRGVGEKRETALASADIRTVLDLVQHYPRRHLDRTREARIADLHKGDEATVFGEVRSSSTRPLRGRRTLTEVVIGDGGHRLTLTFFNQRWREKQLQPGMTVMVHGKCDLFRGNRQMTGPVVDLVGDQTARIVPVYPQSEKSGLLTRDVQSFVEEALKRAAVRGFADPLPDDVRERFRFVTRDEAINGIHHPESMKEKDEARRRLVFDELLRVQLELVRRKRRIERETAGLSHSVDGDLVARFHERLPFALTTAQQRTIGEIAVDLASERPMHRLLQGDVGSGKTVVAVTALLAAVQGGHQGALMAPTEVLAEQHHLGVTSMLGDLMVPDPSALMGDNICFRSKPGVV